MVLSATPTNAFLLIGDGFAIGVDVDSTCPLLFPYRTQAGKRTQEQSQNGGHEHSGEPAISWSSGASEELAEPPRTQAGKRTQEQSQNGGHEHSGEPAISWSSGAGEELAEPPR
ncbi:hypothetical protein GUJ93_ZPchr0013g37720 [Zizania palustris]|uniref:Uncharacterized protein n=1 Tax=Zizania palustris TaxID=103762 RepID=A0A8J5WZ63_ZIZPA|nr:hypothetical protein GUJ93_ZPchr0013g37720 [Zizania palustris]